MKYHCYFSHTKFSHFQVVTPQHVSLDQLHFKFLVTHGAGWTDSSRESRTFANLGGRMTRA